MKQKPKQKVLVALSGGVDSSVAAALLVEKGYDVVGAFMVQYDDSSERGKRSCWPNEYRDALRVAAHLGIPLLKFDFTKAYSNHVLDYLYREYQAGRTPNPDVLCNTFIKFGVWLEKAKALGFYYLATGHYARIKKTIPYFFHLLQAKDTNKDQTYFLHQLSQNQLSHVLFPIGEYTKPEVRALARTFGLPTAGKEESMGICFVGEVSMKEFLKKKIKEKRGNIVTSSGQIIGKHDGLAFYTIGQRHFGVQSSAFGVQSKDNPPLFVADKRRRTNELVVGFENDPLLYKKEITVTDVHWVRGGQESRFPLKCEVRLRHRQPLQKSQVKSLKSPPKADPRRAKKVIIVAFDHPQRAVTPGQFAVFYKKGECLGGGVIE